MPTNPLPLPPTLGETLAAESIIADLTTVLLSSDHEAYAHRLQRTAPYFDRAIVYANHLESLPPDPPATDPPD